MTDWVLRLEGMEGIKRGPPISAEKVKQNHERLITVLKDPMRKLLEAARRSEFNSRFIPLD